MNPSNTLPCADALSHSDGSGSKLVISEKLRAAKHEFMRVLYERKMEKKTAALARLRKANEATEALSFKDAAGTKRRREPEVSRPLSTSNQQHKATLVIERTNIKQRSILGEVFSPPNGPTQRMVKRPRQAIAISSVSGRVLAPYGDVSKL